MYAWKRQESYLSMLYIGNDLRSTKLKHSMKRMENPLMNIKQKMAVGEADEATDCARKTFMHYIYGVLYGFLLIAVPLSGVCIGWFFKLNIGWLAFTLYGVPVILFPILMRILSYGSPSVLMEYAALSLLIMYDIGLAVTFAVKRLVENGIDGIMCIEGGLVMPQIIIVVMGLFLCVFKLCNRIRLK